MFPAIELVGLALLVSNFRHERVPETQTVTEMFFEINVANTAGLWESQTILFLSFLLKRVAGFYRTQAKRLHKHLRSFIMNHRTGTQNRDSR